MIGEDDRVIHLLRTVYGDRVHMPFGYFKVGGARIKFFYDKKSKLFPFFHHR
jgi:hypothetical protein